MNENKKDFMCTYLDWDTKYFGYECSRIDISGPLSRVEQNKLLEYFKKYEYITVANIGNDSGINYWLGEETNAFLSDINIQFQKNIYEHQVNQTKNISISNNVPYNSRIVKIASENFKYSRFLNDPNLPLVKSSKIYEEWTINSFDSPNKFYAIAKSEDEISGYILFSIEGKSSVIELIAVNSKYQGQSIGTDMMKSVEKYLYDEDVEKLKVGTQLTNTKAVNFYIRNNFKYVGNVSLYHLWNKENTRDKK